MGNFTIRYKPGYRVSRIGGKGGKSGLGGKGGKSGQHRAMHPVTPGFPVKRERESATENNYPCSNAGTKVKM